MTRFNRTWTALPMLLAVAWSVAGCGSSDPRTRALRERFLLAHEPTGALGIADSRDRIDAPREVVVLGRIRGGGFDPWAKGKAAFVIAEALPESDEHGHADGHDPATCPFCKRRAEKANATTALVQFCDEQGNLLAIDARELLGVAEEQTVVVRGQGQVNEQGMLIIAATGIHVRG
jgi:hypothetical protein